jgi:hypothetical protein
LGYAVAAPGLLNVRSQCRYGKRINYPCYVANGRLTGYIFISSNEIEMYRGYETIMGVLDFEAYKVCRDEIAEQKKLIDDLIKKNAQLEEKVNAIYGAYETLQYTCEGRCNVYVTEIEKLRKNIELLEGELKKQCE